MNLSSFCFALFLLEASFAQSAPQSYADEDEEALIDRLASLAAAVSPDELLNKPYLPPNYDLSQLNYLNSPDLNDESLAREAVLKMPRQFGYKPNDLRFYLPVDQFPKYPPVPEVEKPQQQRLPLSVSQAQQPTHPQRSGQPETVADDFYFMKKKEQIAAGSPVRNYVPGPSHVMSSDHSANYPGFSATQITEKPLSYSDMYYIAIIAGCSAAAVVGVVAAGICYYRIHERIKAAADVDYPAYGVTGPSKDITPTGADRKLAQSAQMYHYQHQKQQMAALQKGAIQGDRQGSGMSDGESEDDNEEDGDYTVYECPGLAPAGEMEVKNPLFQDEPSKASEEEAIEATEKTSPAKSGSTAEKK